MTAVDCWFIALVPIALVCVAVWACCDTSGQVTDAERARECECHHLFGYHEHLRSGSDCSLCSCTRFRPVDVVRARSADLPERHGVTDETPLVDQEAVDVEYERLCRERGAA